MKLKIKIIKGNNETKLTKLINSQLKLKTKNPLKTLKRGELQSWWAATEEALSFKVTYLSSEGRLT